MMHLVLLIDIHTGAAIGCGRVKAHALRSITTVAQFTAGMTPRAAAAIQRDPQNCVANLAAHGLVALVWPTRWGQTW